MPSRKRKQEEETTGAKRRRNDDERKTCVIHWPGSSCEHFIFLVHKCKGPGSRLDKLRDIATKRLKEPIASANRMEESCQLIPQERLPEHGYHKDCYG